MHFNYFIHVHSVSLSYVQVAKRPHPRHLFFFLLFFSKKKIVILIYFLAENGPWALWCRFPMDWAHFLQRPSWPYTQCFTNPRRDSWQKENKAKLRWTWPKWWSLLNPWTRPRMVVVEVCMRSVEHDVPHTGHTFPTVRWLENHKLYNQITNFVFVLEFLLMMKVWYLNYRPYTVTWWLVSFPTVWWSEN